MRACVCAGMRLCACASACVYVRACVLRCGWSCSGHCLLLCNRVNARIDYTPKLRWNVYACVCACVCARSCSVSQPLAYPPGKKGAGLQQKEIPECMEAVALHLSKTGKLLVLYWSFHICVCVGGNVFSKLLTGTCTSVHLPRRPKEN